MSPTFDGNSSDERREGPAMTSRGAESASRRGRGIVYEYAIDWIIDHTKTVNLVADGIKSGLTAVSFWSVHHHQLYHTLFHEACHRDIKIEIGMKGDTPAKNPIGEIEEKIGGEDTNQRKRLIVHHDVIVMRTVSVIGQGRRIGRGVEVRSENQGARDMMVSLLSLYVEQS